jgi:hypothetical protein
MKAGEDGCVVPRASRMNCALQVGETPEHEALERDFSAQG